MFTKTFRVLCLILIVFPTMSFAAPKITEPVRVDPAEIENHVNAKAYVVIDRTTGKILTEKNEMLVWPIASTTKLMTAQVVLSKNISLKKLWPVLKSDDVGGAKLYVRSGDKFSVNDLLSAMLIGSANNAANALARSTGWNRSQFVTQMNARAKTLGLKQTVFVDPSGIDPRNVSTALELAKVANDAFKNSTIKNIASTPVREIRNASNGTIKKIKTTNWMLTNENYKSGQVIAGKTGYLEESNWNFVTALRPKENDTKRELLVVILGSESRGQSFADVKTLTEWAWKSYEWK